MTNLINPDEHNGWTNKETWAANLWLANDHGLYLAALDIARSARSERHCGEMLVKFLRDEVNDEDINREVGSWWRVDERELGATWVADAVETDEYEASR